jgi:hydrogenase maturation protease
MMEANNALPSQRREHRILVLGYGNPAREDDGLGPAVVAEIERLALPGVVTCDNYQLVVEDAFDIAESDVVWFVDAARTGAEPFEIRPLSPASEISLTSHMVTPDVLLALAERYCGKAPEAHLMGIRGYTFEFAEGMSERACANLRQAVAHLIEAIREPSSAPTAAT